jgi:hypothetical protein
LPPWPLPPWPLPAAAGLGDVKPAKSEVPCAPLLRFDRRRSEIGSRLRSAISPWIDRREELDVIRDELEEHGIAVLQDRNRLSRSA